MPFEPRATERLTLRPLTLDDAADLALRRSDPQTAAFQAWTVPYSLERAVALIDDVTAHEWVTPGQWHQLAVVENASGRTVGDVTFFLAEHGHTAEIGYTLHTWARGKGYATEAAAAMIDHLVDDIKVHRLEASTHPDNVASNNVLTRLGFTLEGIKKESYWVKDVVTDDAVWGMLSRDWIAPTAWQFVAKP